MEEDKKTIHQLSCFVEHSVFHDTSGGKYRVFHET